MVDRYNFHQDGAGTILNIAMTTARDPASSIATRIGIDTSFLLRQVSVLAQVKRKRRTWNELGEKLLHDFMGTSPMAKEVRDPDDSAVSPAAASWSMAKGLVHAVLAGRNPKHDAIRKRLGNLLEPSTPRLLSTLGLWLAGVMGISVSVTGPMVAVMLYAAGEADGSWEVLRDPKQC